MFAAIRNLIENARLFWRKPKDPAQKHNRQWEHLLMILVAWACLQIAVPMVPVGLWLPISSVLGWGALGILVIWLSRMKPAPQITLRIFFMLLLAGPFWLQYLFGGLGGGYYLAMLAVLVLPMYTLLIPSRREDRLWLGLYGAANLLAFWLETLLPQTRQVLQVFLFYGTTFLLGWSISSILGKLSYDSRTSLNRAQSLIEELRKTQERLQQASKAKNDFLANMSHEIRTPMHAISGMADMLLLSKGLGPAEYTQAENIKLASQNLLGLINDVLDISKIEANRLDLFEERYDFPTMLQDVVSIISVRAHERNLAFYTQLDPEIPKEMVGDSGRIRQVLLNLLGNAVKFTEKGYVKLSVQRVYHQEQLQLAFEVSDTGVGIHPGDAAKLYGLFEQLDTTRAHHREGTGLGLAISRRLVELMGGELTMQSEYGQGTTFGFVVSQQPVGDEPIAHVSDARQKSLLVCSDDGLFAQHVIEMAARLKVKAVHGLPSSAGQYTHMILDLSAEESYAWVRLPTPKGVRRTLLMDPATPLTAFIRMDDRVVFHPLHIITLASLLDDTFVGQYASPSRKLQECIFPTRDVHVLVVDDNQISLMVAANLLKLYGISVDQALGGAQALRMLEHNQYDIVFVDHIMPEMDGLETVRAIRKKGGALAKQVIIALSANVMTESRKTFLAAGVTDSLTKPLDLAKLSRMLQQYLPAEKIMIPQSSPGQNAFQAEQLELLRQALDPLALRHVQEALESQSLQRIEEVLSRLQTAQMELMDALAALENALSYPSRRSQLRPVLRQVRMHMRKLGEGKIMAQAQLLENAVNQEDNAYVSANLNILVSDLAIFLNRLGEALNRLHLPPAMLQRPALLERLHETLLSYDLDGALMLLDELEQREPTGRPLEAMDGSIRDALARFDYNLALSSVERLLAQAHDSSGGDEYAS